MQRAVYAHRLQTEGLLSFKLRVTLCGNFHERERGMICEVDGNGNFKRAEVGTETEMGMGIGRREWERMRMKDSFLHTSIQDGQ